MKSCQEIKCFWRILSCSNITVTRWSFGARKEILSFAFLVFLWDNALQKPRIPSHFAKCEPLICTLYYICKLKFIFIFIKSNIKNIIKCSIILQLESSRLISVYLNPLMSLFIILSSLSKSVTCLKMSW